jgi:amino acid transporter
MYLRLPNIVGEAGLWATLGIIIVAHLISATTGLSVSSIATDKKVKAGGTYYMISRSLGLPIGGTLGLALFVGLSFSVSLYLIGFSESFLSYWGWDTGIHNIRITGTIVLLVVTIVTFISTSLALKTQYFIMAAIVLSLISIFAGSHDFTPTAPLLTNTGSTVSLMVLFGIFFPAVTGFEAGVSMSGDLKDPKKSIPRGSIAAIVVGLVVYIILAFFLSYTVSGQALAGDSQILLKISRVPELVVAGIWGATLSSALGSILGAPRILQATAIDKITGKFFAKGYGGSNEPRNALLLTFAIAETGILIGELDVIARVVSIFFITTYGFLNLSCAFETWTSADFRPQFKVSGWISLIGALACFIVMIELDFVATIAASLILGLLFLYLKRKELTLDSGDAWSSIWATLVKKGLQRLTKDKLAGRNWRPNILLFSGPDEARPVLVEAGKLITGKLGILSSFEMVVSKESTLPKPKMMLEEKGKAAGYFKHRHICHDVFNGMEEISRIYGFSGVQPNTILMGWSKDVNHRDSFIKTIAGFEKREYNTLFLNVDGERGLGNYQTIDIWWNGSGRNLAFAIYLLRHLTVSLVWKTAKIRICYINDTNSDREQLIKSFGLILNNYRLQAEIEVVNNELNQDSMADIVATKSRYTDLVMIGLPKGHHKKRYDQINPVLSQLGTTLIVHASKQFEDISVETSTSNAAAAEVDASSLVALGDLEPSSYPLVETDIQRIDERGQKLMEILHSRLFAPVFSQHVQATERLIEIIKALEKNLKAATDFDEEYRQHKQLTKAKNEFLYSVRQYFNTQHVAWAAQKQEVLAEALDWYLDKLANDINRFPIHMELALEPRHILPALDDTQSISRKKLSKRIWEKLGRKAKLRLNYRRHAAYHLHDARQVALKSFLAALLRDEQQFHKVLKDQIDRAYDLWERVDLEEADAMLPFDEIIAGLTAEIDRQKQISARYADRLRLDFRKQVQTMSDQLSSLDANEHLKHARQQSKAIKSLTTENADFPEKAGQYLKTLVNKYLVDIMLLGARSRVEEKMNDFKSAVENSVQKQLDNQLTRYQDSLEEEDVNGLGDIDLESKTNLLVLFENHTNTFNRLIEDLPEEIDLFLVNEEGDEEVTPVPVRKMTDHYLNNHLVGPMEESLETLQEKLKKVMVSCREMVSLARFNINNLEEAEGTLNASKETLLADCHKGVAEERQALQQAIDDFVTELDKATKSAFEPLSSTRLLNTSANFSRSLLDYQGQQVKSGVLQLSRRIREFSTTQLSRLLYSRSKGLIFAKKLTREPRASVTSRLLDYKEHVSPEAKVLKALPGYYVSLFSGRSTIDKGFWIKRPADEALFKKAIHRYRDGFSGGILITGQRNSGKTTFSRFQALKYYKSNRCFQVFPKPEGSIDLDDFKKALNSATGIRGQIDKVMNTIPEGSVVIIHDLELWWQRTDGGLVVVKKLCELIDTYGRKCLFVINTNPYTADLINQLMPFNDYFIEVIACRSFESEELKELIMKRHQSTGLELSLAGKKGGISELGMAKLFDGYFSMSQGNPGVALNAWLANIMAVGSNSISIEAPQNYNSAMMREINTDWQLVLVQLVLHKRLSFERLQQNLMIDEQELQTILLAMFRAALLVEKREKVYAIDPYMEPMVEQALKGKNLI